MALLETISDFTGDCYHTLSKPFKQFSNHVVKLWGFHLYLWRGGGDFDWDMAFCIDLVDWKLQRIMKDVVDTNYSMSVNRKAKQMKYAIHLIKLFNTTHYQKISDKRIEKSWGKVSAFIKPDKIEGFIPESKKMSVVSITYSKVDNEYDYHMAQQSVLSEMVWVDKKVENARKRFYRHLSRYSSAWGH